jgi:hypothetical protein
MIYFNGWVKVTLARLTIIIDVRSVKTNIRGVCSETFWLIFLYKWFNPLQWILRSIIMIRGYILFNFISRSSVTMDIRSVATVKLWRGFGAIWIKFVHNWIIPLQRLGYNASILTDLISKLFLLSLFIIILI